MRAIRINMPRRIVPHTGHERPAKAAHSGRIDHEKAVAARVPEFTFPKAWTPASRFEHAQVPPNRPRQLPKSDRLARFESWRNRKVTEQQYRTQARYKSRASTETCMSHHACRPDLWVLKLTMWINTWRAELGPTTCTSKPCGKPTPACVTIP